MWSLASRDVTHTSTKPRTSIRSGTVTARNSSTSSPNCTGTYTYVSQTFGMDRALSISANRSAANEIPSTAASATTSGLGRRNRRQNAPRIASSAQAVSGITPAHVPRARRYVSASIIRRHYRPAADKKEGKDC